MLRLTIIFLSVFCISCGSSIPETAKTAEFKVWGNCGMCKKTIEKSLANDDGIYIGDWDVDSKMMTLTYDTIKTSVTNAQQLIAGVGYDNEGFRGDDQAYSGLHKCCKYKRKEN